MTRCWRLTKNDLIQRHMTPWMLFKIIQTVQRYKNNVVHVAPFAIKLILKLSPNFAHHVLFLILLPYFIMEILGCPYPKILQSFKLVSVDLLLIFIYYSEFFGTYCPNIKYMCWCNYFLHFNSISWPFPPFLYINLMQS